MNGAAPRIVALTDVAVGYGTPQIPAVVSSLLDTYPGAHAWIVEPDQKNRPPRALADERVDVVRVVTRMPPYDPVFQAEAALPIQRLLDELRPDIVVVAHAWMAPGVLRTGRKFPLLIYYMLESLSHQRWGMGDEAMFLNRLLLERADLVLTPERRRFATDLRELKLRRDDVVEVYNASHSPTEPPAGDRRRVISYGGSIGPSTLVSHFLDPRLSGIRFEIAGSAETPEAQQLLQELQGRANIHYLGFLPNAELRRRRQTALYSVAMWNPSDVNQLYASPNKMFESVADGVPVIVAPHPQCVEVVDRNGCGWIMADWSADAFVHAVKTALAIADTDRYRAYVDACWAAARGPLSWEAQMVKVTERLKALSA